MRRFAALLITPALVLVGCSSNDSSHQSRPDGWHRPLAAPSVPALTRAAGPAVVRTDAVLPTVSGQFGRPATISVPKAAPSGKFVVAPQTQGRGRSAHTGDVVIVRYTAKVWRTGKALPGSYGKGARPQVFAVGRGATLAALDRVLVAPPTRQVFPTLHGSCEPLGQLLGERVQFAPVSRDPLQIGHPHTLPTVSRVPTR
ncbi:FKBP-type peptidyl-prolyl cis-trans isomerase [Streptomyces mirabilis]|uniref:hypothetical protein n=1 Tax=Streptomyces mirabilis TaxID=68239 RepID=UPI0035D6C72D